MARTIFLLLVLANAIFYLWASNYLGIPDAGREPGRLKLQVQANRLTVTARDAAAVAQVCRRVGPLAQADAERINTALAAKAGLKTFLRPVEEKGYWIFIPPLSDKAAADKKAEELKDLGVKDFFIVTESGPNRYAISLGSFSSEDTAKEAFANLGKKGVHSARLDSRVRTTDKAQIDVRGEGGLVAKALNGLLPAGTPVVDCPQE
jgi:SPOR domain